MKTLDPALQDHLDGGATTLAWCWKVTRRDGMVLGFTEHDRALNFDGTTIGHRRGSEVVVLHAIHAMLERARRLRETA